MSHHGLAPRGRPSPSRSFWYNRLVVRRLLLLVVILVAGCKSPPTSVLLKIVAGTSLPSPDELRLTVIGDSGVDVADRSLPACDAACPSKGSVLPGEVVLYPKEQRGRLRILVRARKTSAVVGEGVTGVEVREGEQVEARVVVDPGLLSDRDGDEVPDLVDNCPDVPNPKQGVCPGADGRVDVAPDVTVQDVGRDIASDSKADRPRDSRVDKPKTDTPQTDKPKPDAPPCTCPLGCRGDMTCREVVASNGFTTKTYSNLQSLGADINTTTCQIATTPIVAGKIQSGVCIFALKQLVIPSSAIIKATGDKPLVFLVEGTVTINGLLDVGGHKTTAGPGGGAAGVPTASKGVAGGGSGGGTVCACTAAGEDDCGGGGGGFAVSGAAGGRDAPGSCTSTSSGGAAYGSMSLVPLTAGSGGASAGQNLSTGILPAAGGAGGGALQITCGSTITINGTINAGGGGGATAIQAASALGGGGGGSGGGVLLEAASFGGSGIVAANGGGGGAATSYACTTAEGEDGGPGVLVAKGGTSCTGNAAGGNGGGGVSNLAPASGADGTAITAYSGGGGGGGSAGRIRFNWYLHGLFAPVTSSGSRSVGEVTVN
jgi:hypothetical protein